MKIKAEGVMDVDWTEEDDAGEAAVEQRGIRYGRQEGFMAT